MLCTRNWNRGLSIKWAILRRWPVKRLSTQRTLSPSARNRSQRCDPTNPAPPVITVRIVSPSVSASMNERRARPSRKIILRYITPRGVGNAEDTREGRGILRDRPRTCRGWECPAKKWPDGGGSPPTVAAPAIPDPTARSLGIDLGPGLSPGEVIEQAAQPAKPAHPLQPILGER
jgi:hypothetical protein